MPPEVSSEIDRLDPSIWKIAAVAAPGSFLSQLDATVVNVSLSSLALELHSTLAAIHLAVGPDGSDVDRSRRRKAHGAHHRLCRRADADSADCCRSDWCFSCMGRTTWAGAQVLRCQVFPSFCLRLFSGRPPGKASRLPDRSHRGAPPAGAGTVAGAGRVRNRLRELCKPCEPEVTPVCCCCSASPAPPGRLSRSRP